METSSNKYLRGQREAEGEPQQDRQGKECAVDPREGLRHHGQLGVC